MNETVKRVSRNKIRSYKILDKLSAKSKLKELYSVIW